MFKNAPRRIEHLHEKACLAAAVIAAVQNYRDDEYASDFDFSYWMQEGGAREVGLGYLHDGTMTCTCDEECGCCAEWHAAMWCPFPTVNEGTLCGDCGGPITRDGREYTADHTVHCPSREW